jgi:hypothetical protein
MGAVESCVENAQPTLCYDCAFYAFDPIIYSRSALLLPRPSRYKPLKQD